MHACGHDVHTSILFGLVEFAARENVNQNILFLFQPAEESGGGAMKFFATGIFNQFKVDKAFAYTLPMNFLRNIASTSGVLFASAWN